MTLQARTTLIADYEPKWDNEPEFDPDLAKTIANFSPAAKFAPSRVENAVNFLKELGRQDSGKAERSN